LELPIEAILSKAVGGITMIQRPILLAIVFTLTTQIIAQGWNGIIPLESNRDDVERIFGKCKDGDKLSCLYKFEKENVVVIYNILAPCSDGILNVPKESVLSVSVFPQGGKKLNDLGMNLKNFVKKRIQKSVVFGNS
jgi:hypothetical protein